MLFLMSILFNNIFINLLFYCFILFIIIINIFNLFYYKFIFFNYFWKILETY